jgi:hypothetical protein
MQLPGQVMLTALQCMMTFIVMSALLGPLHLCAQVPDLNTIVARMEAADRLVFAQQRSYELTRQYQLFGKESEKPRTEVLAKIAFDPPGQKSYEIQRSTGGMGERAIRHALDHEMALTRDPGPAAVDRQNYQFSFEGEEIYRGRRCYVLGLHPKRNERDLLNGKAWVDAETYRISKIEGSPTKNPSFWVKKLQLTIEYAEITGIWLHATTANADIRFGGPVTLVSRNLTVQAAPVQAANRQRIKAGRLAPTTIVGAGIR